MPFNQVTELPDKPPTVRIFLTGQLLVQPNEASDSCEVFVNRSASNHQLTVEVREKRQDGQPDCILMRHYGSLEFRDQENPLDGLRIRRKPAGSVGMYTGDPTTFGEALESAIDLKHEDFHGNADISLDIDAVRPSVLIQDGIFHTALKNSEKIKVKIKKGEETVRQLDRFATVIGANVYLDQGQTLTLSWREMGLPKALTLTKPKDDGVSYEVYVINDPLYVDEDEPKAHDELGEYYKVLPAVPTDARLKMDVEFVEPETSDKGSTKTPCMPVIISGP